MLVSRNSGLYSARSSARNESALAYRRRLLLLSLSFKARVRGGGHNMGLSVTTENARVFRRERTYARVPTRCARIAASRCIPLVSRDAASSRSGLPIPPSHRFHRIQALSRRSRAYNMCRGNIRYSILSDVALVTRVSYRRDLSLSNLSPSRERLSNIFDDEEKTC